MNPSAVGAAFACLLALACDSTPAAPPVVQRVGFTSDLKADEELQLFPALATRTADNAWEILLRAWVYEPEKDSWLRAGALAGLAAVLDLPADSAENEIFRVRARAFFYDNERGKQVVVQIGLREHVLEVTGPNGHSETRIRLTDAELSAARVQVTAVLRAGDPRSFTGGILRVDPTGTSVISDVDDTIKISEVRDKARLLERTFLREFEAVPGMAALYSKWADAGALFHYLSASPWQLYDPLVAFLGGAGYPVGSAHLKLFRVKDTSFFALFQDPKAYKAPLLRGLLSAASGRRFVLVGDSGELDPEAYADAYREFPTQVVAIFIRDVTGEARDAPRYQSTFAGIPAQRWQIFKDPAELPTTLP